MSLRHISVQELGNVEELCDTLSPGPDMGAGLMNSRWPQLPAQVQTGQ